MSAPKSALGVLAAQFLTAECGSGWDVEVQAHARSQVLLSDKTQKNRRRVLLRYGFPSKNCRYDRVPTVWPLERRHRAGMRRSNLKNLVRGSCSVAALGWIRDIVLLSEPMVHTTYRLCLTRTCGSWFLSCDKCTALTQGVSKGATLKFVQSFVNLK